MKKNYTISIPVRVFWRVVVPLAVFTIAVGMLAGVLVVDRLIMPNIVGVNKGMVAVPSVTEMNLEQAREALYAVGLRCDVETREYDDIVPEGRVLRQNPAAGVKVKKGRHVDAVLSKGPEVAPIPKVGGLSETHAKRELRRHGFTIGGTRRAYSDEVAKDLTVKVVPAEGTTVSKEMPIRVVISDGPKPTHTVVPNVIGESLGSARSKIEESGMVVGRISHENNASLPPGTVLSQSVSPGTNVPLESSLDIVVSVVRK